MIRKETGKCKNRGAPARSVAVIDWGSLVLPYDFYIIKEIIKSGTRVTYFGSNTRYNEEFLTAIKELPGVAVWIKDISKSMGKSKLARIGGYLELAGRLVKGRGSYEWILYEFTPFPVVDLVIMALLRKRLVFVCHNAIPHWYTGRSYWAHRIAVKLAREIWCPSSFTAAEVRSRYRVDVSRVRVVQHGMMGIRPNAEPSEYQMQNDFEALVYWGTVKPYKGIESLLELAKALDRGRRVLPGLEVYGRWDVAMKSVRESFRAYGVRIFDEFVSPDVLESLFERQCLFLLTHHRGSQSGIFYTLLFYGKLFLCRDVGDTGRFIRAHGLDFLFVKGFSVAEIEEKVEYFRKHPGRVAGLMNKAAAAVDWRDLTKGLNALNDA